MLVDIYRDLDRILIIKDGEEISRISDAGSVFLDGLEFVRKVDLTKLPTGLNNAQVKQSLDERGFYAARQAATITEVEIQD